MEMLRLDWNFVATIVNLIVLYFLMRRFLFGPVENVIAKRKDLIESKFRHANETENQARQMKEEYQDLMRTAKEESKQIVEEAREQAKAEYEKKIKDAKQQADNMFESAREKIDIERQKMLHELEMQISSLVFMAAGKVIGKIAAPKYDEAMYDKFLSEAGEGNDTNRN